MAPQEQIRNLLALARRLVFDPRMSKWTIPLQLLGEVILCGLIIWKVPYTNIDWTAYTQQTTLYLSGERNYAKITGDTGPLVYPAAHVYIYTALYHLTFRGANIFTAQTLFGALYILTLSIILLTLRAANAPPWVMFLCSASKRAHSIFVLRLFNDCWAVLGLWGAVAAWQGGWWAVGSVVFAVGLGVKMVLLLALPAVGAVLWQGVGRDGALVAAGGMGWVQLALGYPFLSTYPLSYLTRAFEFTRQFQYQWTVNWRFISGSTFLSRPFSLALLTLHITLLTTFLLRQWLSPSSPNPSGSVSLSTILKNLLTPPPKEVQAAIARQVTPDFVLTSISSAVIVGCLCARSLHYQFYVYVFWATPYLLWRSGLPLPAAVAVVAAQEWAWNVFPSTSVSSAVVVGCLAVTAGASLVGIRFPVVPPPEETKGTERKVVEEVERKKGR